MVYERFSPFEQHGCSAGGTTHVIATLLAGAEVDADTLAQGVSDFKRMCQRGETQALRIEEWAKAVGVWIDDIDESFTNAFGERIAEGGEASDMHDENVIRSDSGNVFVIDCDIRINTPELKCGGVRNLSTQTVRNNSNK